MSGASAAAPGCPAAASTSRARRSLNTAAAAPVSAAASGTVASAGGVVVVRSCGRAVAFSQYRLRGGPISPSCYAPTGFSRWGHSVLGPEPRSGGARCVVSGPDGRHVVLRIGRFTDAAEPGEVAAGIEVHRWVPQLAVLRQADVFVTHAGMGSSQEGLACGVPLLAVPQAADRFMNADLLQRIGVGRHLPEEEATAGRLRETVLALADDPGVRERHAAVRREVTAEGGTARAGDLVEAELPGARP
ncbi:hypothetical protein KBZ10_20220 [Streptomyces sp. F63]|nr:hypothetical protein [Streptomyces sp. F63]